MIRLEDAKVFTFTKNLEFDANAKGTSDEANFEVGGTGFFATVKSIREFSNLQEVEVDMKRLERNEYLNSGKERHAVFVEYNKHIKVKHATN
ncbi:MAG: hypothetical protein Q4E32_07610 [Bacteroidales bacterium]|nr:hypothetical protein [Bacteroidales bacterium]